MEVGQYLTMYFKMSRSEAILILDRFTTKTWNK